MLALDTDTIYQAIQQAVHVGSPPANPQAKSQAGKPARPPTLETRHRSRGPRDARREKSVTNLRG